MLLSLCLALCLHAGEGSKAEHCHAPKVDSKCHSEVMFAMLDGFAKHPENYVGLTTKSNYRDFQAYFWNLGMHHCPRPCMEREEACVKFDQSYPCLRDVQWAAYHGIAENPEWYPELRTGDPLKDFAMVLYMHGQPGCPRPCDEGEPVGHFVPYKPEADPEDEDEVEESKAKRRQQKAEEQELEDAREAELEDDEEDSTKSEPRQIKRLKKLLRTQENRKVIEKVQSEDDDCARPGVLYAPAITGSFERSVKSSNHCRAHCRNIDGAGHFLFYASLGLCHCAMYGAAKQEVPDVNNLAGPVNCGKPWEEVNQETSKLVQAIDSGCFSMNIGFGPAVAEPMPFHTKDAIECQRQLRSYSIAAQHFVFHPIDGTCRIVAPGAPQMSLPDVVSGPKACEDLEVQMKADFGQIGRALSNKLVLFIGIPSGFMIIGLVMAGAIYSVRRRVRANTARGRLFLREEEMEGLGWETHDDCIEE